MVHESFGPKWIKIDLDHWEHNLNWIRERVAPSKLMPVIKANAYGHGAIKIAQVSERMGIETLIVATLREALELRRHYINTKILVLGVTLEQHIPDLINYKITPTVCRIEEAQALNEHAARVGQILPIQVYVDTGMGRMGQVPEGLTELFEKIEAFKNLKAEALYSHYAVSDETVPESVDFTQQQWLRLKSCYENLKHKPEQIHISNSGGVLSHASSWADAVRPGLLCYGIPRTSDEALKKNLKPVMSLACRPTFIKRMHAGESVGYGRIFKLEKDTNIMTLPVGYADGVPRRLGSELKVVVKGRQYPIVGRVCMDMLMVDLGDDVVEQQDTVHLLGDGAASVQDWAEWSDTIPYEIFTSFGRRWNYVYTRGAKVEEIVLSES